MEGGPRNNIHGMLMSRASAWRERCVQDRSGTTARWNLSLFYGFHNDPLFPGFSLQIRLYTYTVYVVLAASSRPPQAAGVRVNKEMQITPRCIFYCRRRRTYPHLPPLASLQGTKVYYFSNCPPSSRMSSSGGGSTGVFLQLYLFYPLF